MRSASVRSSALLRGERPSVSTALRIAASGFLISCASDALSSATASRRSARAFSVSSRFWSEMSWKIAVAVAVAAPSPSDLVVFRPIGKRRSRTVIVPFGAGRACAVSRSAIERTGQFWRGAGDRFDYPGAQVIIERNPEELRGCRVRIDEPARGVDRDDSAAYVLKDVGSLEADLHQFRRKLLGARTRLAEPGRDVPAPKRNRPEYPSCNQTPRSSGVPGVMMTSAKYKTQPSGRDQQPAGERQEQRRGGDDEYVQGGELRVSAARYMDDRSDDSEVEQRLTVKESGPERTSYESRCTPRSRT